MSSGLSPPFVCSKLILGGRNNLVASISCTLSRECSGFRFVSTQTEMAMPQV